MFMYIKMHGFCTDCRACSWYVHAYSCNVAYWGKLNNLSKSRGI